MSFGRRILRAKIGAGAVAVVALAGLTGGCSTVVFQDQYATAGDPAVEREALVRAASEVGQTKWAKPEGASLGRMLAGVVVGSGDRVTEDDAVEQYLVSLSAEQQRALAVLADAERHLAAAYELALAAEAAADSLRPSKTDVSLVESAIGDLRGVRDVYVASLKRLSKDGEAVDAETMGALRSAFNDSIERIGDAADRLADAVAHDRTQTLATRPARRDHFSGGSL